MASISEWKSTADWESAVSASASGPVLLLKHSTTCPISANAYSEYSAAAEAAEANVPFGIVKVIESRPLSNHIAEATQVRHESPQAMLLKDGKPVWVKTHYDVTQNAIQEALSRWQ